MKTSLLALALAGCHLAGASQPEPPTKMELLDAARLESALVQVQSLKTQCDAAISPHSARAANILARYRIPADQLGRGVKVDFETGAISRQSEPRPAAAKPDGGTP